MALKLRFEKPFVKDNTERITKAEADINFNAQQIAMRVTEQTYNALENRVSGAESSLTLQADKIETKVEKSDYNLKINQIEDNITTVTQKANGLEIDVKKYNDGKLSGQNYNFTGTAFEIGGKTGDTAKHSNSESRWNHSDGSYTRVTSAGMERYIAGSGRMYHHLMHMIGFVQGSTSSVRWIQLPDEFKGKQFRVYAALADTMQITYDPGLNNVDYSLYRMVVTGHPDYVIDYENARVPIIGYKLAVHKTTRALVTSQVQGLLIAIF